MQMRLGFEPEYSGQYFLCYNEHDEEKVGELARSLRGVGMHFWYNDGLEPGKEWEQELARGMKGCKAVLVIITERFFEKPYTDILVYGKAAEYFGAKLVPLVLARPNGSVPPRLRDFWNGLCMGHFVYLTSIDEASKRVAAIEEACAETPSPEPLCLDDECRSESISRSAVRIFDDDADDPYALEHSRSAEAALTDARADGANAVPRGNFSFGGEPLYGSSYDLNTRAALTDVKAGAIPEDAKPMLSKRAVTIIVAVCAAVMFLALAAAVISYIVHISD